MASYRDSKVLVAAVCGLLTGTVLGLGVWRTMAWIQTVASSSKPPLELCRNGGTWANDRCNCPELWRGLRCTIPNFCENSTDKMFTFKRIPVGSYGYSEEVCERNTPSAGKPMATRLCTLSETGQIKLEAATTGNCSASLQSLETQIDDIRNHSENISTEVQILTSNVNQLTSEGISAAANVVGQIFNLSNHAVPKAKEVAVATVSQLLEAREDVFQRAVDTGSPSPFNTLIKEIEDYSLSLSNGSVVQPNIAVQSVAPSENAAVSFTSVRFSVLRGSSDSFSSGSTSVDTNTDRLETSEVTELQILLSATTDKLEDCGFVAYQNSKLFQSKKFSTSTSFSQKVISGSFKENKTRGNSKDVSVEMAFNTKYRPTGYQLHSYACVYWDFSLNDWDTRGCVKVPSGRAEFLHCRCNHTTSFAVLMSFLKDYKYPEPLDRLSTAGCALSITGLALTVAFQIVTRKGRKSSVTWVLVSLCSSMLIFNLLFVFGIENSNKNSGASGGDPHTQRNEIPPADTKDRSNPGCTAVAALLHYFALATFTWSGLSAAQLHFLLLRTMKPLPPHFTLYLSLTGWGVPAGVVAMTVGIIYAQHKEEWELKYRQEEVCWLAILEEKNTLKSPFLWSFAMPVSVILLSNVAVFITITVKVLWKKNQHLTSTKRVSSLKKLLSTLSTAVIFGITWLLAYLMLIDDRSTRMAFSYIFCLFNTTQGLQIFILYTVRNKVFQREASKVWKSLSSSTERMTFRGPSVSQLRLRVRMYNMLRALPALNERFRLLEPSVATEETALSAGGPGGASA
ncbi:adhesion G-protein coupled receptor G7 [Erinaceus europaeus]|uniref:Adhesion G-protein coupled receptor G7 n=1 Tax=Erinaceus europaeus TaxID=9365 RepID=A0ABM3VV56_ERIEU|nr:adhesion G-protein coupled receptor G7 [Erinaceus europaeus]